MEIRESYSVIEQQLCVAAQAVSLGTTVGMTGRRRGTSLGFHPHGRWPEKERKESLPTKHSSAEETTKWERKAKEEASYRNTLYGKLDRMR
uniref:Uncharacterized protein n=1 Tax=Pristionchus pacificus TaxID=54126 RepID=A0A2A6CE04_PRIPA|eukprot:PDM76318.1 hypothetical protein PRIPAC_39922 [Pristionchus pacificus]